MPVLPQAQSDVATTLALALVDSSNAPVALLDGDLNVVGLSASFVRAFHINAAASVGRPFSTLGGGEWNIPQLRALLAVTASGAAEVEAYEMDLHAAGRQPRNLVLHARKLDYGDTDNVRLLLTVSDVTEARANDRLKDDLIREKAVLLQEVQHRVANSLQIIASVILQNAPQGAVDGDARPPSGRPSKGDVGGGAAAAARRLQPGRRRGARLLRRAVQEHRRLDDPRP